MSLWNFLKNMGNEKGARIALESSFDKHYKMATGSENDRNFMGAYAVLVGRLKLRGMYISDVVHNVEIIPFMLMSTRDCKEMIVNYTLFKEKTLGVDERKLSLAINRVIRDDGTPLQSEAWCTIATAIPHLQGAGIEWFSFLEEDTIKKLVNRALKENP